MGTLQGVVRKVVTSADYVTHLPVPRRDAPSCSRFIPGGRSSGAAAVSDRWCNRTSMVEPRMSAQRCTVRETEPQLAEFALNPIGTTSKKYALNKVAMLRPSPPRDTMPHRSSSLGPSQLRLYVPYLLLSCLSLTRLHPPQIAFP